MCCFNRMLFCPTEKVEKKYGVDSSCLERPQNYQYMAPRAGRPMDDTGWWKWWGVWEFTLHHWVHQSVRLKIKRAQKVGRRRSPIHHEADQRPHSWTKSIQQSSELSSLLFTVSSTALPWDFCFFQLTQPLTVSTVQLQYTIKEKGEKPDRKPYPLPFGLRNPYRNLKSENSQDYAQKPQRNCTFMNSASGLCVRCSISAGGGSKPWLRASLESCTDRCESRLLSPYL